MMVVLFIISVIALIIGGMTMVTATTVWHEILAGLAFLAAAVLFSSAAIVDAVNAVKRQLLKLKIED